MSNPAVYPLCYYPPRHLVDLCCEEEGRVTLPQRHPCSRIIPVRVVVYSCYEQTAWCNPHTTTSTSVSSGMRVTNNQAWCNTQHNHSHVVISSWSSFVLSAITRLAQYIPHTPHSIIRISIIFIVVPLCCRNGSSRGNFNNDIDCVLLC